MSWISKSLTLDLLAITIDGLNKAFERISAEPEAVSPWPVDAPADPAPVEAPPAAPQPTPAPAPPAAPQPEPEVEQISIEEDLSQPAPPKHPLLLEAQNILRTIAQTQGTDWITGTLFPHFGTNSLNTVPLGKLPELIEMANSQAGTPA